MCTPCAELGVSGCLSSQCHEELDEEQMGQLRGCRVTALMLLHHLANSRTSWQTPPRTQAPLLVSVLTVLTTEEWEAKNWLS